MSGLAWSSSLRACSQKSVGTSQPHRSGIHPDRVFDPVNQDIGHVASELGIRIIERCNVGPVVRISDVAVCILLVILRVRHHHAVPCGVIGHHIKDDLHIALVCFHNKSMQIVVGAERLVDRVVIAYGVRTAE